MDVECQIFLYTLSSCEYSNTFLFLNNAEKPQEIEGRFKCYKIIKIIVLLENYL